MEAFQQAQGIRLGRRLPIEPVADAAKNQHIADDGGAAHTHRHSALQETIPAGDEGIGLGAIHGQYHRCQYMGIPISANAALHGRNRLYIKAGDRMTQGCLSIERIVRSVQGIGREEGLQRRTVYVRALGHGDQIPLGNRFAAGRQQQAQEKKRNPAFFHGATGSPASSIRLAHSRQRSISSQMRKQPSQTSRRQIGHWLKRSLASFPASDLARCRSRW